MGDRTQKVNLVKLVLYILKRIWLVIICAGIGFAGMYSYTRFYKKDTYTAYATMYVLNGNPNVVNYQYANANDLNSAMMLVDTYMVVIRSSKVMDAVAERLAKDYPGISTGFISNSLSMGSVKDTSIFQVYCSTADPKLSADICNAVVDAAPAEIIRVVSAGNIEVPQ